MLIFSKSDSLFFSCCKAAILFSLTGWLLFLIATEAVLFFFSKIRYTKTTLEKIESLLAEAGYNIRYEKGNFQSGSCVLESRKMIIINRFYETEGRVIAFLDILQQLIIDIDSLSEVSQSFYHQLKLEAEKEEMV